MCISFTVFTGVYSVYQECLLLVPSLQDVYFLYCLYRMFTFCNVFTGMFTSCTVFTGCLLFVMALQECLLLVLSLQDGFFCFLLFSFFFL